MSEPLIIDVAGRPVTVAVRDDTTTITIGHKLSPQTPPVLLWTFGPVQEQQPPGPGVDTHMTTMTATQQVSGKITPVDAKGRPAPVQKGSSAFVSSDDSVVTVHADPSDELAVLVKAVAAGSAQVRWTADADLGDGVVTISAAEDFVIQPSQAVGAGFSFGTPVEQS